METTADIMLEEVVELFKPMLRQPRYKQETLPPIRLGGGINTFGSPFEISQGEAIYSLNMSNKLFPSLSTRAGRALSGLTDITTPNVIGQRANANIHVQDGTVWKRWTTEWVNVQTELTSSKGKFLEFTTGTTKFTVLFNGTDRYSWDGTTAVSLTNAPLTNLITAHKGRLYAAKDNDVYFTALNLLNDWSTINEAGKLTISRARSPITAITVFNDFVTVLTGFSLHAIFGTGPHNYSIVDISQEDGCIADGSVIECSGVLYWLDNDYIKAYTGAQLPEKVSDKVDKYIRGINYSHKDKIVSGKSGKYVYWSIPYGSTENNMLLEYDTKLRTWFTHSGNFVGFTNIGKDLYGVTADGKILIINSGAKDVLDNIAFEHITGPWLFETLKQKTLSDLWLSVEIPQGSTLSVSSSESIDGDDFVLLKSFSSGEQNTRVQLPTDKLQRANWFRLKFAGTGPCVIHFIEPRLRIKGR